MEYLVAMMTHVPDGTSEIVVSEIRGREAARLFMSKGDLTVP